jgi:uncharacterized repeat protein (TIGR01451 family)
MKSMWRPTCLFKYLVAFLTLCVAFTVTASQAQDLTVYSNDFEDGSNPLTEWNLRTTKVTLAGNRRYLGDFTNQDVRLTLNNLPPHTEVTVSFDLYILASWDGNEPDIWNLGVVGGPTLLRTTFGTHSPRYQAYPGSYPGSSYQWNTGAAEVGTLGDYAYGSAVYRITRTFSHTDPSLVLQMFGQNLSDEFYGIDNIQVSIKPADTEYPETAITGGPGDNTTVGSADVTFTYSGYDTQTPAANLLYHYSVDGGPLSAPTSATSVTLNNLSEGMHTFSIAAVDTAGNIDPTPATTTFCVDLTAPVFVAGPTVSQMTYNSARIDWTTDDAVAGTVEVALNDGTAFEPILTYTDSRTQTGHAYVIGPLRSNTGYCVRVISGDAAGNKTTSPEAIFMTSPLRDLSVRSQDITFSNPAPANGQTITASVAVRNSGDLPASGTLVFYDYSPATGTREISRHSLSVAPNLATAPVITSAPFAVAEGMHTPYVQILNVTPADDIPGNNGASKSLFVGAPAQRLTLSASDQRTFPGDNRLFAVMVKNTGAQAVTLSAPALTGVPYAQMVNDLPAEPLAPGAEAELQFRLLTPTNETGGPPANPVQRPVTVTLNGFSTNFAVEVYSAPVSSLDVTVVDEVTGLPLGGALVATDGRDTLYVAGPDGKLRNSETGLPVTIPVFPGTVTLYGYKSDHIARTLTLEATASSTPIPVVLRLAPGQTLEVTKVTARPLTLAEIQQRGVNLSDPSNYAVYDFTLYLKIGAISVPNVVVPVTPAGGVVTGGGMFSAPGGINGTVNIQWVFNPTTHTETWIIIPGDVRILKQFWDASVFVRNNSDTVVVNNLTATLEGPPDGLSLPELDGSAQPLTKSLGTLLPHEEKQASWVLRGDKAGTYRLTGRANGDIQIGGTTVPLVSALESGAFNVVLPKVGLTFETPAYVQAGQEFIIGINVANEVPVDLHGVGVNIKTSKLVNCVLAPGETASHYIGTIPVGQTGRTTFRFTSLVTGYVQEVRAVVSPLPVEPDITVVPVVNRAPDAVDDTATTNRATPAAFNVLSNDTDPEGDTLTVTGVSQPTNGTASFTANGSVTYTPGANFVGLDTFTYTISDGNGNNDTATVRVQVNDPNAGPAQISVASASVTRVGGNLVAQITLSNIGGSPAQNLQVSASQVGSASTTTSPLPGIASLAPGASTTITLTYPGTAGNTGAAVFLRVSGSFTGGTFSSNRRVTLP